MKKMTNTKCLMTNEDLSAIALAQAE